jgi:hypothetical protein
VYHDRVARPGVTEQLRQPLTLEAAACLLVGVDPLVLAGPVLLSVRRLVDGAFSHVS